MSVDYAYNEEVQYYQNDLSDEIDTISFEAQKKYSNCKTLYEFIISYLFQMKEKLFLDDDKETIDNCLNIMMHFKWSEEQLVQSQYFDNDEIKVILYQGGILFQYKLEKVKNKCEKCDKNLELYQIGCNHYYCYNCYEKHIIDYYNFVKSPQVKCISDQCNITIPYQLIIKLSDELQNKFRKLLCKSYLENNYYYSVCVTNECENILMKTENIYCLECQQLFCQHCNRESHFPMSCDKAKLWINKVDKLKYYSKQEGLYQFCYLCKEPYELIDKKCYLINCQCGVQFCSICGYNHEFLIIDYEINCQFIQNSTLEDWEFIHIFSLSKFKENQAQLKDLKYNLKLLSNKQTQFLQIQKFKVDIPSISSSFKTFLEMYQAIIYMIPHFEYYNPEKWAEIQKKKHVNIDYYNKCISDQQLNYKLYSTLLGNNMNQLQIDSLIYDEIMQLINKICSLDQQLLYERNKLVLEIQ
ncbi:hypothetical protein pb186bvf_007133 [Paramecium bursaria]